MEHLIPYGRQWIDDNDIQAVIDVLKSDFLTQGPKVIEFEEAICNYTGAKYCVAFANGTATLQCAVASLNIDINSEGITSPNTFVASSNSMIYNGLKPVFSDIDEKTYNINPLEIQNKLTNKTKLIIPVHFAGQSCDMKSIYNIAKKNNLYIIEDAAHAIGSMYKDGSRIGNCRFSDMTSFSFHPVKTMTTGEGGAITTNNKTLYEKLKTIRNHGITRDPKVLKQSPGVWYYEMQNLGYNYRITDFQSALGITQLNKLDMFIEKRQNIVTKYNKAFCNIKNIIIPFETYKMKSAFHLYVLQINFDKIGINRNEFMRKLKEKNIGTQVHYIPVHTQPYYKEKYGYKTGDFPITEKYYTKALSIPLYPKMTDIEIEYVIENIINQVEING
jgi:perosamine synthetase